jgi:hypothetical protein
MKARTDKAVYEQPGLEERATLRPDVVARLELLRMVWRPDRSAQDAIKVCEELEKYVSSGKP